MITFPGMISEDIVEHIPSEIRYMFLKYSHPYRNGCS